MTETVASQEPNAVASSPAPANTGAGTAISIPEVESYEERISKMTNKQLCGEIRREADRPRSSKKEITAIATVLGVVFDSHMKGRRGFIR